MKALRSSSVDTNSIIIEFSVEKATESGVKHKYVYQIHVDVERALNSIDVYKTLTEEEMYLDTSSLIK